MIFTSAGSNSLKMRLEPHASVTATDKRGAIVDLASLRGRRIKKTHRHDDGRITAVIDLGTNVVGLVVNFANEADYELCRAKG